MGESREGAVPLCEDCPQTARTCDDTCSLPQQGLPVPPTETGLPPKRPTPPFKKIIMFYHHVLRTPSGSHCT